MNASKKAEIKRKLKLIDCANINKTNIQKVVDEIEEILGIATTGGGATSRTGHYDYSPDPDDEDDIANRISDRLIQFEHTNPLTSAKCKQLVCEVNALLDL